MDTYVIQLYMHDMATQYDNMLKSTLQVDAKHAIVSTAMYIYIYIYISGTWIRSNPFTPPQPVGV